MNYFKALTMKVDGWAQESIEELSNKRAQKMKNVKDGVVWADR